MMVKTLGKTAGGIVLGLVVGGILANFIIGPIFQLIFH